MRFLSVLVVVLIVSTLAVSFCQAKTECERKREDAEKQVARQDQGKDGNLAIVVPNCDADGNYAQLQCHHGSTFCQCWDKDGYPLTQPKKELRKCACMTERAKAMKNIPPSQIGTAYLTDCENNGNFKAKQCGREACWCVNPDTGSKVTSENKNKSAVKC